MELVIARWQIRITRVTVASLHRPVPPPPAVAAYQAQQRERIRAAMREQIHAWTMLHGKPNP